MRKLFRNIFLLLIVTFFCLGVAYAASSSDEAVLGNDRWSVNSSGDLIPNTTNSYDIGSAEYYPASICLGGECKTGWGSIVSPMTDAEGYVYPTDSGGDVKLYDTGYISLGGNAAQDAYVLFDIDSDNFYMGVDETDEDLNIGYGSTIGTDARITIADDTNNSIITIGDGTDSYDHYLVFDGNAADAYFGYLDTYDMLIAGYGATMDADMCFGIEAAATPLLVLWQGIDGYGAVDLDYGSGDITDHTFVSDGGTVIIDGIITLTDAETISNPTDDTVRISSNDADTILEIYTPFDTTGDAYLQFAADLGDAEGETWRIGVDGATTDLLIRNDDALQGTQATILTISDPGIVTTTNVVNIVYNSALTNTVQDMLAIKHSTSDTAAASFGAGIVVQLEDASGNLDEAASIDIVSTTATHGSEDTDIVFSQFCAGTVAETIRFVANSSATTSDYLKITGNTTETNGIVDMMQLVMATGTAINDIGIGISWQPEDATGAEEHASLDLVLTDATRASCDADFVFTQDVAGTLEERVRFDADGGTVKLVGTLPNLIIGDAGEEDTKIVFDGNAQDYHLGIDDAGGSEGDLFTIGKGTALGTTPALTIDSDLNVVVTTSLKVPLEVVAATNVITANEGGKVFVLSHATEFVTTLPTASTAAGMKLTFIVGNAPEDANYTITTGNTHENVMYGCVQEAETDTTEDGPTAQAQDTISFIQAVAVIGDYVTLICDGTNWYVSGMTAADGAVTFTTS